MRKKDFDNLVGSIREAGKIRRGEMKPSRVTEFYAADVRTIRQRLGKSQSEFARMIGVSVATLQNWEQGPLPSWGTGTRPVKGRGGKSSAGRGCARSVKRLKPREVRSS